MRQAMYHFLGSAVLLCILPTQLLAAPEPSQVPVRALSAEVAQAAKGTPAYVHTPFGTGNGFYVEATGMVMVARHAVLTPSGEIADAIDAGLPQLPLHNILEERLVAVAQDPVHDLILLRLAKSVTPASLSASTAVSPCEPAQSSVAAAERAKRRARRARQQEAQDAAGEQSASTTTVQSPAKARLHVVYDGPATQP